MTPLLCILLAFAPSAGGAPNPRPADEPTHAHPTTAPTPVPAPTPAPKPEAPPSLDELLGLEPEQTAPGTDAAEDAVRTPEEEALDRRLTGQDAGEQFEQAAELMNEAAWRMGRSGDLGIGTQRMHEDILRKLDMVIAAAEQNAQQSSSSSSSSGQQQPQPQEQPNQASAQQQSTPPTDGDNRGGEHMPGDAREARLSGDNPAAGAAWGALPERVRDALLQGINDPFSTLYQRQTEAYYRRLAEEPEP